MFQGAEAPAVVLSECVALSRQWTDKRSLYCWALVVSLAYSDLAMTILTKTSDFHCFEPPGVVPVAQTRPHGGAAGLAHGQ